MYSCLHYSPCTPASTSAYVLLPPLQLVYSCLYYSPCTPASTTAHVLLPLIMPAPHPLPLPCPCCCPPPCAPATAQVDGKPLTAKNIVVAVGGRPTKLPIPGAELCITSDEALELPRCPK